MRLLLLRSVLVATDLGPSSRDALETAHRLAALAGATLHVAHVAGSSAGASRGAPHGNSMDDVRAAVEAANMPIANEHVHVIRGEPAEVLPGLAHRLHASVIVLGRHNQRTDGRAARALGSTARSVAERVDVPCLIAAQPLHLPLRRVLVPTDFSEPARGALLVGLSWASGLRAGANGVTSLTALHVQPIRADASERDESAALVRELDLLHGSAGTWADIAVHAQPARGDDIALTIERYAVEHDADLVVLGTRGLRVTGDKGLGSVSEAVAIRTSVPTLLVPPAVWREYAARH